MNADRSDGGKRTSQGWRRERDEFKDAVLRAARMPIYRIRAQPAYDSMLKTK